MPNHFRSAVPSPRHLRKFIRYLLLPIVFTTPALGQNFTFNLIAEEDWNQGRPSRESFLDNGRIYLFRTGSYLPEVIAEVGKPQEVPPGSWHWIAEAEGYVSVVSGRIVLPEGQPPFEKGLVEPVVPACKVLLSDESDWAGLRRLDAVSLERGAVFPVAVDSRRSFQIPVGRFVAYVVGAQGMEAIAPIASCRRGETVHLQRPEPPDDRLQDLVIHALLPPGVIDTAEELGALLSPFEGKPTSFSPLRPSATFRTTGRVTFFFLGIHASETLMLEIRHPHTELYRQEIPPLGGKVHEFPLVNLMPNDPPELHSQAK